MATSEKDRDCVCQHAAHRQSPRRTRATHFSAEPHVVRSLPLTGQRRRAASSRQATSQTSTRPIHQGGLWARLPICCSRRGSVGKPAGLGLGSQRGDCQPDQHRHEQDQGDDPGSTEPAHLACAASRAIGTPKRSHGAARRPGTANAALRFGRLSSRQRALPGEATDWPLRYGGGSSGTLASSSGRYRSRRT